MRSCTGFVACLEAVQHGAGVEAGPDHAAQGHRQAAGVHDHACTALHFGCNGQLQPLEKRFFEACNTQKRGMRVEPACKYCVMTWLVLT